MSNKNYPSYYKNYKPRNTKRKIVALVLSGVVVFGVTYGTVSYMNKPKLIHSKTTQAQQLVNKQIEDYSIKGQELKSEINKVNKIVSLEGTKSFTFTFKNKDIAVTSNNSFVKFVKTKLEEMTLRECNYNTEYKFMVTYDSNKIEVTNDNNKLYISIYESDLQVCGLQENKDAVTIESDNGILTKDFNKQETVAMSRYAQGEIYNYLVNSKEIRDQAIEGVKSNISDLCNKVGVKNFQIEIHRSGTLDYSSESLVVRE
jgi:hypothetical protein